MERVLDIKEARTTTKVLDLIRKRFSPRSFRKESLKLSEVETLVEAASWAPSAMNEQPWRFAVALRSEEACFSRFASFLMPGNRVWAKNAGALMLIMARKSFDLDGRTNHSAAHDVGLASMNLLLQALDMGIYGHLIGGFAKERVAKELDLASRDLIPITMLALGRLDSPDLLEEPFHTREMSGRTRRPVSETILRFG